MLSTRLTQQMQFIVEIDRLKTVLRQTLLTDQSRQENSAEHSWHLALMAVLLLEYAPESVNLLRVIKMVLIHDLVEIDAGDTFCYDVQGNLDKAWREEQAANRLFELLPADQALELRSLWEEFEVRESADARFAAALDRLQPFLNNWQTEGGTWRMHGITSDRVLQRMAPIQDSTPELWAFVQQTLEACLAAGYLA